jgi:hypothetical protein
MVGHELKWPPGDSAAHRCGFCMMFIIFLLEDNAGLLVGLGAICGESLQRRLQQRVGEFGVIDSARQ